MTDELRKEIIAELRTYRGTPWVHQGRTRQGIDCIGLALVAARKVGMVQEGQTDRDLNIPNYGRFPYRKTFQTFMNERLIRIKREELKIADLVLITLAVAPMHVGVLGNYRHDGTGPPFTLIEARTRNMAVTEVPFDHLRPPYAVHGYYRFPGLD